MNFAEKLANVVNRYNEVESLIAEPNISSDELGYGDNEHCLFNLWNSLRNFINDESPQIRRVCKLIKELDEIDKGSTTFRYAYNHNKERKIIEYNFPATMIHVNELKKRMMQLYCFFEGINHLSRIKR